MARPDAQSVALARDAFWLLGDVDVLSQRFDARLACLTPRAEAVFSQAFPRGGDRFVSALLRIVDALGVESDPGPGVDAEAGVEPGVEPDPGADAVSQAVALAALLSTSGMLPRDFPLVVSSMVRAVRDSYTGDWSSELESAWSQIDQWLTRTLLAAVATDDGPGEPGGPDPQRLSDRIGRFGYAGAAG